MHLKAQGAESTYLLGNIMLSGHFISSEQGNIFITQFGEIAGDTAILCLPSITEEMNLARAVVAKQAQDFANKGVPCFVLDYCGTGDSEGEFEQATTDLWLEDMLAAGEYLQQKGIAKIILWGIRFGALLVLSHQEKLHQQLPIIRQVLWKPVTHGKLFAGQFLRIKQANAMMNKASGQGEGEKINWREHILEGNDVEVSGYLLTKTMLQSMESLQISKDFQPLSPLDWFELAAKEPTPLTKRLSAPWDDAIANVHCFDCPPFWQVPEVFSLPDLEQLTSNTVCEK